MPKIQKQLSRKVGDKEYPKYVITIPPEILKKYNVQAGDEVEIALIKKPNGSKLSKKDSKVRKVKKSDRLRTN